VKSDYRKAELSRRQQSLCEFAEKLTRTPAQMTREDVDHLRQAGLSDRDVVDLVQVIAFFNYINRIADGLGVDPETWMR
jgi:uncharacterized peroxidase-related enzyme